MLKFSSAMHDYACPCLLFLLSKSRMWLHCLYLKFNNIENTKNLKVDHRSSLNIICVCMNPHHVQWKDTERKCPSDPPLYLKQDSFSNLTHY